MLRDASGVVYYATAQFSPGLALGPDGHSLAIVDGARDEIFLIDAHRLKIVRAEVMTQPSGLLARVAGWLGLFPAAAEAKGLDGVMLNASFSADGSRLYVDGWRGTLKNTVWNISRLGIRAVDVATGQITGWAYQHAAYSWVTLAPDDSAVYAELPTTNQGSWGCPCRYQRLDPVSLSLQTERTVDQHLQLIAWLKR
jgi:hypothetical protein